MDTVHLADTVRTTQAHVCLVGYTGGCCHAPHRSQHLLSPKHTLISFSLLDNIACLQTSPLCDHTSSAASAPQHEVQCCSKTRCAQCCTS